MATIKKKFDVCAGRQYSNSNGEQKIKWIKCGEMVIFNEGGILQNIEVVPAGNWWDGKFSIFEQKPREENHGNGGQTLNNGINQQQQAIDNMRQQNEHIIQQQAPMPTCDDLPF